jgi:hypothetical protein
MAINHHPAIHDPCGQVRQNQPDHASVIDVFSEPIDQDVLAYFMVQPVPLPPQLSGLWAQQTPEKSKAPKKPPEVVLTVKTIGI